MIIKNPAYAAVFISCLMLCACKCNRTHLQEETGTPLYVYSFEKTAPLSPDNTKKLISDFLGMQSIQDLTVSKDENIAYFVSPDDVNTTLEQDLTTGNFAFNKFSKVYLGDFVPQLPGKEDAIKISEKFIRDKGLFPKNAEQLKLVHEGGLRAQSVKGPIVDKLITLTYGRIIDSLQVIGAGSKIAVNIGDKGEVLGLIYRWRELNQTSGKRQLKPEELISREEAEGLLKRQIAQEFGAAAKYDTKSVNKSYYDNNGTILQPVYAFETVITLEDKQLQPIHYLGVVEMLKNSPEPLHLLNVDPKARDQIKMIDRGQIDTSYHGTQPTKD
ncbi:hypothetical protein SAMN05518672_113120 [Chitinophaga sp. CF118]|uniref:hypothetical protein n=1 Tax=Chitinophaga sp. CF118 TaxID=1884367 RepID=UPI0008E495F9|nr:hypothetical protein [Chitinophaga sp. CF118]SFE97778.1 hypothetical protein SAMN05518672_113120 [Chitinophaga sp. CF118]